MTTPTTPTTCASCGHVLGIGRFCTNCGQPVAGRHPAATLPPAQPSAPVPPARVPPPAGPALPAARYPLFADPPPGPAAPPPPPSPPTSRLPAVPARAWLPWLAGLVLLALVAGVGALLLVGSDGGTAEDRPDSRTDSSALSGRADSAGTGGPVEAPDPGHVEDLTSLATAEVPSVAPESRDRQNRPVSFRAANMFDGRARTSWRMAGDGTGATLTFDLGIEAVLTEVGLINGYAKVDGPDNWYQGNRRIRVVQWEFDDGTRITQDLAEQRSVQTLEMDPVLTRTVRLHLVEVGPPGTGPNGRDFTAISEVRLTGAGS